MKVEMKFIIHTSMSTSDKLKVNLEGHARQVEPIKEKIRAYLKDNKWIELG